MLQPYANLSPEGTPVNLDKFHYTVTERLIEDRITQTVNVLRLVLTMISFLEKITDDSIIFYVYVSIMLENVRGPYILVK